ncbi:MATE family efflux transporter [Paenibacillus sp. XY044]|uniref:MATE family efflux transporter n=1 Tax=Paenibacillus sp. XY044 TaxID=2026089 RepID=UPI000B99687B|nr:MATE family efflux transporter [Paenibacillus sp. XY044]OZB96681.1 MATE family efflux transporter [Paenibacillus sp. XY044]
MSRSIAGDNPVSKLSLLAITWPIFVESALQMFLRTSDTFMLSKVSDGAVAAVGVANQIIMFAVLMFNFVALGSAVVISQYLGARRQHEIGRLAGSSLALNFLFGLLVSIIVMMLSGPLLRIFDLDPSLFGQAKKYLLIAGGALVIQALLTAVTAMIQSHGLTRQTMVVTIGMNVLNIFGNYLFIYGPGGFPKLGVVGVAISTAFAQCVGLAVNLVLLRKAAGVYIRWNDLFVWSREHIEKVLRVGVPSSAVSLSYSANQFVTTAFISSLGASVLATKIYTQNIMFFVMILAVSLGRGGQIIVGQLVGAGQREEAYKQVIRNLIRSELITLAAVAVLTLFRQPLMKLFTTDPDIIAMGAALLLLSFLLEPGRNFNVILERSLQAAGDARSAMIVSITVTWLFSVPLTYLLGIHWGYGLYGIWAAFIADEWLRGILLWVRWRSKAWQRKALVQLRSEEQAL